MNGNLRGVTIRSPRTHTTPLSLDKEKLQELTASNPTPSSSTPIISTSKPKKDSFKHYKSLFHKMSRRYGYMFRHLKQSFMPRKIFPELSTALKSTLKKTVPLMVDKRVNEIAKKTVLLYVAEGLFLNKQKTHTDMATLIVEAVPKERHTLQVELSMQVTNDVTNVVPSQWSLNIKFEKPTPPVAPCRIATVHNRGHEDHHDDDARLEGESSAKRQRASEHGAY
ncbi:hypothetical protein Tco_1026712 [Tanacetum coccineum]